jgi:hypothetical protein
MASSPSTDLDLNTVVQNALAVFTTALSGHEFATFLNKLQKVITTEKSNHDAAAALRDASKRPTSQGSKQMSIKEVTEFIKGKDNSNAIFLVTGGSFNPPHNGHIRMFETAYNRLMQDDTDKDKKVYGVMVPAPNAHIDDKLCKEVLKTKTCSEHSRSDVQDAIKTKRIDLPDRIKLCKLSCDSFEWTNKDKFGPSNMIVVNESENDPGDKIVSKSQNNTYYLCGSDYYAKSKGHEDGSGISYKFIFITRKGDETSGARTTRQFKLTDATEFTHVKDGDIMIQGKEDDDSEASSSRLREILEKLKDATIGDDTATTELPVPTESNLLTKEVYCQLLKTGYIVGKDKGKTYADFMDCTPSSGNDTDEILKDVDGVRHDGHRSLCNIGNMCYMNAALQLLYSMPEFKEALQKVHDNPLKQYLNAMDSGAGVDCDSAETLANDLYDFAGTKGFANGRVIKQQEDPNELIMTIFANTMFDKSKDSMTFTTSQATVYVGSQSIEKCKSLDSTVLAKIPIPDRAQLLVLPEERDEKATERTLELPIAIDNGKTPLDTFDKVFKAYTAPVDIDEKVNDSKDLGNLTNNNGIIFNLPEAMMKTDMVGGKYIVKNPKQLKDECRGLVTVVETESTDKPYRLRDIKSKSYIFPGPTQRYFIVLLKRTITDGSNKKELKYKKLTHAVNLDNANINIGSVEFIIKGCICHHGDGPNSGHYTYVEFKNGEPYMVYDDTHICPYSSYVTSVGRTVDVTGYVLLFERKHNP